MEIEQRKGLIALLSGASAVLFLCLSIAHTRKTRRKNKKALDELESRRKNRVDVSELLVNSNDEMVPAEELSSSERAAHSYRRLAAKRRPNYDFEVEPPFMRELRQGGRPLMQSRKVYKEDQTHAFFELSDAVLGGFTATQDEAEESLSERDKSSTRRELFSAYEE